MTALWELIDCAESELILTNLHSLGCGFVYVLEPDCWNEKSTLLQTWVAASIIKEIGLEDKSDS
jgi:hypothetical protein